MEGTCHQAGAISGRSSLMNKGFFEEGRPEKLPIFTDLPQNLRPFAAESPAVEEFIEEEDEETNEKA